MTATHKECRVCGKSFKRSPADRTVNCPEHRGRQAVAPKARVYDAMPCARCGHVHTTLRCDRCGF